MNKIDLISILAKKNNDFFRQTTNKSDENYIFDNQVNTGRKIVIQLASNTLRTNHVMLVAIMQSGKTGTCNSVINIINKARLDKNMAINKFLFITGMNDCGLKNQTYERLLSQVSDANVDNTYFGKRSKRNLSKNKYFVLKNSDLLSYEGILDNSLIFIDESHYGTNEKNILTKFLYKHGVDWKNTNQLIERNIYIVSISATPFDELVSDTVNAKKIVELNTDENYFGVSEYLNSNQIYCADKDDIAEEGAIFDYIRESKERMDANNELGFIFIRTRKYQIIEDNPFVQRNFDIFEMDAANSKIQYDVLETMMGEIVKENQKMKTYKLLGINSPKKPLIILIKGAFRAGITINATFKNYIYMMYDYSTNADTTAQALLGRMCGYRGQNNTNIDKTYIYINKLFADMYSSWEKDFQNRENIPSNGYKKEWVSNEYAGDDVFFGSRPCGNFSISLDDNEILNIYNSCKNKRNRSQIVRPIVDRLLAKNNYHINYNYLGEAHVSGKNNYSKSSQEKRFNQFSEDSLVFQFRPEKISDFIQDNNRNYLSKEDIGKSAIYVVLDAEIYEKGDMIEIKGNKRLLVYHVEVGQKRYVLSRKKQYKSFKDTKID